MFIGGSSGLLTDGLTRTGTYWRLLLFLRPAYEWSAEAWQGSIVCARAVLSPWAGFVFAMKPNMGLALITAVRAKYWPTNRGNGPGLLVVAFLVQPHWVAGWRENIGQGTFRSFVS